MPSFAITSIFMVIVFEKKSPPGCFWEAQDTAQPDSLGDWIIQALFVDQSGQTIQQAEEVIVVRLDTINGCS
jgi:hypothetical protein